MAIWIILRLNIGLSSAKKGRLDFIALGVKSMQSGDIHILLE